jgi:hypothetical protein
MRTAMQNIRQQVEAIEQWYANPERVTVLNAGESAYPVGTRMQRTIADKINADLQRQHKGTIQYEPDACYEWKLAEATNSTGREPAR